MPGRSKRHSEKAWADQPEHVVRCVGTLRSGSRCLKVAEDGTNVCEYHGGSAPQVQRAAAERMVHSAPAAAEALLGAMNDPGVPWGVRVKIMQDVLDRSGLAAAQVHKVMPMSPDDPVETLFRSILDSPDGLVEQPAEPPALAAGPTVRGQILDPPEEPVEDHEPDAEVTPIRNSARPPRHIRDGLGLA